MRKGKRKGIKEGEDVIPILFFLDINKNNNGNYFKQTTMKDQ